MEKKIVTIKTLQYEKMYREFFKNQRNVQLSKSVFFHGDTVSKTKTKVI